MLSKPRSSECYEEFIEEKIVQPVNQAYYVLGRNKEKIYFVKRPTNPIFGGTVTFSIPTIGDLNRSDYSFNRLFTDKGWCKINNNVRTAIYDEEFQKEVNTALNIISITLPSGPFLCLTSVNSTLATI